MVDFDFDKKRDLVTRALEDFLYSAEEKLFTIVEEISSQEETKSYK